MEPSYVVHSYFWQIVDHWQTLITGLLAIVAGFGTIWGAIFAARLQVRATQSAANEQVAAANEQTEAVRQQNRELRTAEKRRMARDTLLSAGMLDAALEVVASDIAAVLRQFTAPSSAQISSERAQGFRQEIGKPGFDVLWTQLGKLSRPIAVSFIRLDALLDRLHADRSAASVGGLQDQLNSLAVHVRALRMEVQTEMAHANSVFEVRPGDPAEGDGANRVSEI